MPKQGSRGFWAMPNSSQGDRLTLADIVTAQIASWARAAKVTIQPTTAAYLARMEARLGLETGLGRIATKL